MGHTFGEAMTNSVSLFVGFLAVDGGTGGVAGHATSWGRNLQ